MAKVLKDEYLIKLDSVVIYVEVTKFKAWYNTKMKNKEGLRTSTHNICIVMALFQWFEVKFTPQGFPKYNNKLFGYCYELWGYSISGF